MSRAWWIVGVHAVFVAVALAPFPEVVRALAAAPAVLFLPGWPWARAQARTPAGRVLLGVAFSVALAVPALILARLTGTEAWGVAGAVLLASIAGTLRRPLRPHPASPVAQVGLVATLLAVVWVAWSERHAIQRPLDAGWWFPDAETAWEGGEEPTLAPGRGGGWEGMQPLGWPEAGAVVLRARSDHPYLLGPARGPLVLALRAPVGAWMEVGGQRVVVQSDPVVDPEEGPVPRYLDRGVVGARVDLALQPGEHLPIRLSDPTESLVYLLPTPDAVWSLHATGALRFVHYYQLLNMVEQLRWADELGRTRWVTDVQPPLWSWVLGAPLALTEGAQPTANVVLLALLVGIGAASVLVLDVFAPHAPLPAWLLPGLAVTEHARLLYEPGSAALPDSLYTLGALAAVAALGVPRAFVAAGLGAQLARYPGTLLAVLPALLDGRWRDARRLVAAVVVAMVAFGVGGALSGSLAGWLDTVWFETGPEHWHGESDPQLLLGRAPGFYLQWALYAGGTPLLAALAWPRGTRVLLGTALLYSLLLCTIDHSPSHYFLPLVHLSALACGTTAAAVRHPAGVLLALAGAVGLWISIGWVPITG